MAEMVLAGPDGQPMREVGAQAPITVEEMLRRRGMVAYGGVRRMSPLSGGATVDEGAAGSNVGTRGGVGGSRNPVMGGTRTANSTGPAALNSNDVVDASTNNGDAGTGGGLINWLLGGAAVGAGLVAAERLGRKKPVAGVDPNTVTAADGVATSNPVALPSPQQQSELKYEGIVNPRPQSQSMLDRVPTLALPAPAQQLSDQRQSAAIEENPRRAIARSILDDTDPVRGEGVINMGTDAAPAADPNADVRAQIGAAADATGQLEIAANGDMELVKAAQQAYPDSSPMVQRQFIMGALGQGDGKRAAAMGAAWAQTRGDVQPQTLSAKPKQTSVTEALKSRAVAKPGVANASKKRSTPTVGAASRSVDTKKSPELAAMKNEKNKGVAGAMKDRIAARKGGKREAGKLIKRAVR